MTCWFNHFLRRAALASLLVWVAAANGQQQVPPHPEPPEISLPTQEQAQENPQTACAQPAPMVRWEDYEGPFDKVVGAFGRRLDRTSIHPPHYKPGVLLCSLTTRAKFTLFIEDSVDPVAFLGAAFNAGIDQAENTDHSFGQGAAGYGKRFGAELADNASGEFFKEFLYPTIFSEDPRYYRLAHGRTRRRLLHAMEHVFVAHQENGELMFNFSEWLGSASTAALADAYHPDNKPGIGPAARGAGYGMMQDVGWDVLREFWPEIARKLRLPFRGQNDP
ncbi:MAG: hypothetical protein ABSA57_07820 [Candidatus Acidiferrales bacterium]|jgi:hypothetical protein